MDIQLTFFRIKLVWIVQGYRTLKELRYWYSACIFKRLKCIEIFQQAGFYLPNIINILSALSSVLRSFSIKVTKGIISLFFLFSRVGERKREKGMEYCERVQRRILGPFIHSTRCTHSWFLQRYHMDINSITVRHKKQFLELKKSYPMDSYIMLWKWGL